MFSRRTVLNRPVKDVLTLLKGENTPHVYIVCPHARSISSLLGRNNLKTFKRNVLCSGLQARYQSSVQQPTAASAVVTDVPLDPIPAPPTPLSELTQSAAEIQSFFGEFHRSTGSNVVPAQELVDSVETFSDGPEIYIRAMEVWRNFELRSASEAKTDAQESGSSYGDMISTIYQTASELFSSSFLDRDRSLYISTSGSVTDSPNYKPPDDSPEIYKTAVEIWKDNVSEPSTPFQPSENISSGIHDYIAPQSDGGGNVIVEATHIAEQLTKGTVSDTSANLRPEVLSSLEYSSIFDDIPEPPVVPSSVDSTVAEVVGEPSFASLGLGGSWPSGWVQTAMEFLHIDCGLPWWGAVVAGSLVLRLMMFPVVVISQRNTAKLNNNLPEMQFLQLKVSEARQRGDKLDAARYTAELMRFMQEKEVNPLKSMIPPLLQAPVFLSVFIGLRKMANLPVESLQTGGILWFVDLTVPDQFYLLPMITSATLYCTLKLGVDAAPSTSANSGLFKYLMMGLPVVMLPLTVGFPGLLLCYWTTANFISLAQVGVLRIPAVRKFCNIPPLIRHNKEKLPQKDKGFVNSVKDAWTNVKITGELQQRERADRMAFMAAGREPIVKTYKYDPTQVRAKSSSSSTAGLAKKKT